MRDPIRNRLLSFLLVLALVLPSCASENPETAAAAQEGAGQAASSDGVPSAAEEQEAPEETEKPLWESLPEVTFDGWEFRFIENPRWADTGATVLHGDVEELDGEAINDAIYNRNRAVESRFDVKITTNPDSNVTNIIRKAVKSGDDVYAAAMTSPTEMLNITLASSFRNLYALDGIVLTNPWYNQLQVEKFTIHDKLYFVMGDVSYSTLMFGACLIYNVSLGEREGLPYIHDVIMEGEWTIDKMYEMTEGVAKDLNGDGQFREGDDQFVYAMNDSGNLMNFQYSAGEAFVKYDKEAGTFVDIFNVDRMQTIIDKMIRFYHDQNRGLQSVDYTALFNSGKVLLRSAYVGSCVNHREMEDTFTPIPYTKFDTAQEQYLSMMTGSVLPVGIPSTVGEADRAALILEALSELSARDLNTAVYEQVLAYQTMRNEDAYEILRLIHAGLIVDIGYLTLTGGGEPLKWIMGNLVVPANNAVASFYEKHKKTVDKFYEKLNENFIKLE